MQVVITVKGPLGMQAVLEHNEDDFDACVNHVIKDFKTSMKKVDSTRRESWQSLDIRVSR